MTRSGLAFLLYFWFGSLAFASEPISFDYEVLPTLTRAGCNSGSCHGAAVGRGGFHLSLWGSNPRDDYAAIVREFEGRRVDVAHPTASLILKKPTGEIDHEGGAILDENSVPWKILHAWIEQGAQRRRNLQLKEMEISWNQQILPATSPITLPLQTRGTIDVTALFLSTESKSINHLVAIQIPDPSSLKFDTTTQQLSALRPGIHTLIVRYCDRIQALQILTPNTHSPADTSNVTASNTIDYWLDQRREALRQTAAPLAPEASQLRRVMLDLIGRAPTPQELSDYLTDSNPDKYQINIDRLISSPEYVRFWTYRWTRVFGLRPNSNAPQGLHSFYQWMQAQIADGTAWDQVAREMITATGDTHQQSPAFFMLLANDPRQQAEQFSRWFIGARLECANCHDHPLDRWKQDDYHGLAAVFARIDRKQMVRWLDRGAVTNPRTGLPAIPQLPGGSRFSSSGDVRGELVQWMLEHPDSLFAKTIVNRVWSQFFGRGLVEPVDDMRLTNPATHPQLLESLAESFKSHQYDLQYLIRQVVLSDAYRRQSPATTADSRSDLTYNFGPRKSLPADVLLDLIDDATGSQLPIADASTRDRAVALEDPTTPSSTLDTLGRCVRSDTCVTPSATSSLTLMLHWINGETLNDRIANDKHWLNTTLQENLPPAEMLERLYIRTLCRSPNPTEQQMFLKSLAQESNSDSSLIWEDLFWALLSSKDFLDNR